MSFYLTLKKQAEYNAVNAVFGWVDKVQWDIHQDEWNEVKPSIIQCCGVAIGRFLLQDKGHYIYFGRFFLLPAFQGKGIGSQLLGELLDGVDTQNKSVKLSYLQDNRVANLYKKFALKIVSEDDEFVHMLRMKKCP